MEQPNGLDLGAEVPNADVWPKAEDEPNAPADPDAGGVGAPALLEPPNPNPGDVVAPAAGDVAAGCAVVELPNAEPDAAGLPNPPNPPDAGAEVWPNTLPGAGVEVLAPNADVAGLAVWPNAD